MQTEIAKVTLWKPKGLITVRATQMSDSQHNIKPTKNDNVYVYMCNHTRIHIHAQLHSFSVLLLLV